MTQLQNIRIAWAAAFLLMLSSQPWCAQNVYAEVRLHKFVAARFSPAFRSCGDTFSLPSASLQPEDSEETRMSSLLTIERSLQRQHSRLAILCPTVRFLHNSSAGSAAGEAYANPQTLPLQTAAWSVPQASLDHLTAERSAPCLRQAQSALLTKGYAATALGCSCTMLDLTSSLWSDETSVSTLRLQRVLALQVADGLQRSVVSAYRVSPIGSGSGSGSQQGPAPQTTVNATASAEELQQPTREGEALRRWVVAPNVAARLRRDGFQLITTDEDRQESAVRQARLRPDTSAFRAP